MASQLSSCIKIVIDLLLPLLLLPPLLLLLQAGRIGRSTVHGITAWLRVPVLPVRSVQVSEQLYLALS
jgi:hypothetical protein